jgi:hypothetical protein
MLQCQINYLIKISAKAGIQLFQDVLDPGFRRGDAPRDFLRDHQDLPTDLSRFIGYQ